MADEALQQRADQAREAVNSWVAQFVPLVMGSETLDYSGVKQRLTLAEQLSREIEHVTAQTSELDAIRDGELISTFRSARSQLGQIETDLRIRLGKLSPGDPESHADLTELQDRLAETAAKIEMGVTTAESGSGPYQVVTSPPNYAAGGGMFIFGLGWNAFTLFHATVMIGGMYAAFGPAAFALLLFYAIFFAAGFGMWASAFVSAAEESIVLDRDQLTIHRKLGPISITKTKTIDVTTDAFIGRAQTAVKNNNSVPVRAVILTDDRGQAVNIAMSTTEGKKKELCREINARLAAVKAEG